MNKEQLRQNAAAMIAHADGKPIEVGGYGCDPAWSETRDPWWRFDEFIYRPKPEPKVRPWNCPADVPGPVCWVRRKSDGVLCFVVEMFDSYIRLGCGSSFRWSDMHEWEFSTTRRADDWHKCEITEAD